MRCKFFSVSRKSQSHVEMIVSFVIFVGFVVFLLLMFNPQKYTPINYGSIDRVQAILMKNLSVEYNYTSVILNKSLASDTCFKIDSITGISGKIAVKGIDGATVYSNLTSGAEIIIKSSGSERFYGLYSADFFSELTGDCPSSITLTKPANYSIGILSTKNAVLYENIKELNASYYSNYEELKKNLGIRGDFYFIVKRNGTIVLFDTRSEQLPNVNILSREIPFLSINKTGSTETLLMNLGVW